MMDAEQMKARCMEIAQREHDNHQDAYGIARERGDEGMMDRTAARTSAVARVLEAIRHLEP